MKTKFLFSTLVMAAAFSACTQEEIVMNNEAVGGFNEVAGAVLLGNGLSVVSGETVESRIVIDGNYVDFSEGDKAGVAWAVKSSATDNQGGAALGSVKEILYANHMLVHNGSKFESRGNIYEGWHFAYRPFEYMNKPQALEIELNGKPLTGTDLNIDKYENAPMFSNALFLNEDNVITEEGRVTADMDMSFIVNSLRPTLEIDEVFTGHDELKKVKITGITVSAGSHKLFTPAIKVLPKYLEDMTSVDAENKLTAPFVKASYFGTKNKAFTGELESSVSTVIDNAEAYNLGKKNVSTRIFLAPTQSATNVKLSDLSFRIDVAGGHFDVVYTDPESLEEGEELTERQEINNAAIEKLWYWLNGEENEDLNANARDLKTLYQDYEQNLSNPNCTLPMSLGIENFTADYLVEDITDWDGAVIWADALCEEGEVPTFTLKKGANVEFTTEINAPENGVNVVCENEANYSGWLTVAGNLAWNENIKSISKGAALRIGEEAELTVEGTLIPVRMRNYGTIYAGVNANIGNNTGFENFGRVVIEYGAYVDPVKSQIGTIAYVAVKDDQTKPYRIKNLIATSSNQHGHANVNTLIINKSITIDFTKAISGTPDSTEDDPYNDMVTNGVQGGKYNYGDLSNVTLEINGGTVLSSTEETTVKAIEMKGGKVSDIVVTEELALVEGTNTVNCSSIGTVEIENGKNTITAESILGAVSVKAGTNTISNAAIAGNVTVDGGSVTLNDVNITGDLTNKGTVTINGETTEIENIINNGTLNANTDVVVKTIAVNSGSKANVAENNTIWYTIPQKEGGYIQKGTTTGEILFYGTEQFLNDLDAAEEGATVTLNTDVELSQVLTINKDVTIDLNGKTLTTSVQVNNPLTDDIIVNEGAQLTISNGTISTMNTAVYSNKGNVTLDNCTISTTSPEAALVYAAGGILNIEGGSITGVKANDDNDKYIVYVVKGCNATFNTNVSGANGGVTVKQSTLNITGGTYDAEVHHGVCVINATLNHANATITNGMVLGNQNSTVNGNPVAPSTAL